MEIKPRKGKMMKLESMRPITQEVFFISFRIIKNVHNGTQPDNLQTEEETTKELQKS